MAGYRVVLAPDSLVYHSRPSLAQESDDRTASSEVSGEGAASGKDPVSGLGFPEAHLVGRLNSRIICLTKNYRLPTILLLTPALLVAGVSWTIRGPRRQLRGRIRVLRKAVREFSGMRRRVWLERRVVRHKVRKIPDRVVMKVMGPPRFLGGPSSDRLVLGN